MLQDSDDLSQLRQFRRLDDGRFLFRACPWSRTFLLDPAAALRVSRGIRHHHWRLLQMLLPAVILIALAPILLKLDQLQPLLPLVLGYAGVSGYFWYRAETDDYRRVLRQARPAPPELALRITWTETPSSPGQAITGEPSPPAPQNRIPANQDGIRLQEANKPAVLGVSERLDAGSQVVKPEGGTGELRVQLAALQSRQAAIEQGVELQVRHWDLIGSKVLSIERLALSENRGTMYGIQIGPFWDIGSATNLCSELKTQGQDCFVVP